MRRLHCRRREQLVNNHPSEGSHFRVRLFRYIILPLLILSLVLSACTTKAAPEGELPDEPTQTDDMLPTEPTEGEGEQTEGQGPSESEQADEPASVPEPGKEPDPEPTPFPMFDIIDGRTVMLSITEEEFIEFADFLRDELELNDASLAGILSNIQFESGFDPNKVGDMGNAYGLCQWRGPRLEQMIRFCEENGLNPVTREGQLRFLVHDLKEVYIYAYDQIRLCRDSEEGALQATYFFCAYYEVPSDPDEESVAREELTELLIYPRLNELSEDAHL